jgi:hypothetical protein
VFERRPKHPGVAGEALVVRFAATVGLDRGAQRCSR